MHDLVFIVPDCPWLVKGGAEANIHSSGILEFFYLFGSELSLIGYQVVLAN